MQVIEVRAPGGAVAAQPGPPTLFLHGFPAIRSIQNRDLAAAVAQATGRRTQLLLYDGLGFAPGRYSFAKTLAEVRAHGRALLAETTGPIDLVGHSWGGFLAIDLAAEHASRIRRMVLMSPLVHFPRDSKDLLPWLESVARDRPEITTLSPSELADELIEIGRGTDALALAEKIRPETEILLLQATNDQLTPPAGAQALAARFRSRPLVELIENDHSFLADRDAIARRLIEFLR